MAAHNEVGEEGEDLAEIWLKERGYEIVCRNWRHKQYELDIVASRNNRLHFIEVKSRHHSRYGHPEDSVTKKKFRSLKRAADEYLYQYPGFSWIQYDILSITMFRDGKADYFFLEDVFL